MSKAISYLNSKRNKKIIEEKIKQTIELKRVMPNWANIDCEKCKGHGFFEALENGRKGILVCDAKGCAEEEILKTHASYCNNCNKLLDYKNIKYCDSCDNYYCVNCYSENINCCKECE